jgi:hypothetical protein
MPQARRLALVLTACALLTGCSSGESPPLPPGPAPPQASELHWGERYPAHGAAVVFSATRFEITESGWRAEIGLENQTSASWRLVEMPTTGFGVMLFPTDDVSEVESRSSSGDLPGLREAQTFDPALPPSLGPGESWHGTIAARGPLAAGLYARVVFGLLAVVGDTPEGMSAQFSWITDHSYRLRDAKQG